MVVVTNLGTTHAAEKFFCPIGASAVQAVRLLVIDPLHLIAAVKIVLGARFISMHNGSLGDARFDE